MSQMMYVTMFVCPTAGRLFCLGRVGLTCLDEPSEGLLQIPLIYRCISARIDFVKLHSHLPNPYSICPARQCTTSSSISINSTSRSSGCKTRRPWRTQQSLQWIRNRPYVSCSTANRICIFRLTAGPRERSNQHLRCCCAYMLVCVGARPTQTVTAAFSDDLRGKSKWLFLRPT